MHTKWTGERLETHIFNETSIEHLHRYAVAMELADGKKVLDIACGEGYGSNLLAVKAASVTGMDIDEVTIDNARKKYRKENIEFIRAMAEKIPCGENEFDLVVSFETLEHLSDHDSMLTEIKRILKPGGLLIISTPDKKNYSDKNEYHNRFHARELYREEFEELLKSVFTNVRLYGQEVMQASYINSNNPGRLDKYSGDYEKIEKNVPADPLYHIALASDNDLPLLSPSIFSGESVLEKALLAREKMVTGTITYRLGHFLLYPLKLIRNIFKK